MDYHKQILGDLILVSKSNRTKFNETFNLKVISELAPLIPRFNKEELRSFLKGSPEVCSQIAQGKKEQLMAFEQPVIYLLYYAFDFLSRDDFRKIDAEVRDFYLHYFEYELAQMSQEISRELPIAEGKTLLQRVWHDLVYCLE